MTKRLIDINDHLLQVAQMVLGVNTWKDTVNGALACVVKERERTSQSTAEVLRAFADATPDLGLPEIRKAAWQ